MTGRDNAPAPARGSVLAGKQQHDPATRTVRGENARADRQPVTGEASQQSRRLAGQPGEFLLPAGHDRDPHRSVVGGPAQLAGKIGELPIGQPWCQGSDGGQHAGHDRAAGSTEYVGVDPGTAADRAWPGAESTADLR